jgi:hypothetical protein
MIGQLQGAVFRCVESMSTISIRHVVDRWNSEGVDLYAALPMGEIERLSALLWRPLSDDVKFLYSICGGMPEGTVDERWFELWPLERAVKESSRFPRGFLPFAEGFLSAHLYCLHLGYGTTASVHIDYSFNGESIELIAPSLEEAFRMLIDAPTDLHLP